MLVETYEIGVLQCGFSNYPQNSVEAKFSIAFTAAAAFVYKRLTGSEFCEEVLNNPLVRDIAEHTAVTEDPLFTGRYPQRWGCRMTVTMRDASIKTCQIDDMSGSVNKPLTPKQERDKFMGLAQEAFPAEKAGGLLEHILQIDGEERLADLS